MMTRLTDVSEIAQKARHASQEDGLSYTSSAPALQDGHLGEDELPETRRIIGIIVSSLFESFLQIHFRITGA